ncbi:hypothetical protein [Anaerosinus sp.]|uniref:hypothetical protein n=1 Tax=Selenobaculum sp. TaxID=3074374 RepID=UPI003AB55582
MRNGDKIRAMNDAELAAFMNDFSQSSCQYCCFAGEQTGTMETVCMAPPMYDCERGYQEWIKREAIEEVK